MRIEQVQWNILHDLSFPLNSGRDLAYSFNEAGSLFYMTALWKVNEFTLYRTVLDSGNSSSSMFHSEYGTNLEQKYSS